MKPSLAQWIHLMRLPNCILLSIPELAKIWEVTDKTALVWLHQRGITPFCIGTIRRYRSGPRKGRRIPSKLYISTAQLHEAWTETFEHFADQSSFG